ncbi:hypothetical protein ACOSQ2_005693 [Xanthoceras sorbifolium]
MSNSMAETPSHFYKVILPETIADKKLRIPEKFVREFGDELPDVVRFIVPNGQVWRVGLMKDGRNVWFHDGWHHFIEYYSITARCILVFKYEKNSNFHVLIFNLSACEILYPRNFEEPGNYQQNSEHQVEMESKDFIDKGQGSSGTKRKGRGKARGVAYRARDLEVNIYQGRILTPEVVREISIIFSQNITGPWITYTEYPKEERERLFARFKRIQFRYTCSEEDLKAAFLTTVSNLYRDWMCQLRKPVFKKYKSPKDRIAHPPNNVSAVVWKQMVDKWTDAKWQDKSKQNANNQSNVQMYHTTGSVPYAKYRYEQLRQNGVEPSPIECFKKFNMSKTKDGGEKWTSEKAKELHEKMEFKKKSVAVNQDSEIDDWDIYREVVGTSHGYVLGMGRGIKAEDGSCKRARVARCAALETPSHFFKVIPATLEDKKLLTKDEKKIWLHDSWHDFVKCYSISAGPNDEKNSLNQDEMKIEIMDFATPNSPSNSLKNKAFDKCRRSSSKICTPQSQVKRDKPSLGLVLGTNRCGKCSASFETPKYNPDSSTQDAHEEEVKTRFRYYGSASARKRKVRTNEREREIHTANAFEPANPYCRVVMRPSYLTTMCLPSSFSKKHFNGVLGFIKLQLSNGKQWPVRCIYRRQRAVFSQGWRGFMLDNNLGEGDVCVFEVLRSRDIVVKVTVFRVLKSAEFVNRPSFGLLGKVTGPRNVLLPVRIQNITIVLTCEARDVK